MNVLEIPFVKKVGISKNNNNLELAFTTDTHNHLETIHASAQFTLAETASGEYLQNLFPELVGKVIPVLREASVKFRKPAVNNIIAYPSMTDEAKDKFNLQFTNKGRASICIEVEIRDIENTLTSTASYNWFVQKID